MSKKKTKTLYHPFFAVDGREFDKDHANRLMSMENNGGWQTEKIQLNAVDGNTDQGDSKNS